jgi:hypothetical protein
MTAAQAWLKFIKPFVRVGFKNYSRKQHGFGNALSYLKLNAIKEDFTVDPSRAMISWGDLPGPLEPGVSNPESGVLEFTWQPILDHEDDHAFILAYSPDTLFDGSTCGARRDAGKHILKCGIISGEEVDVYLGFISEDRQKCSNSVYLGRIKVT